MRVSEVMTRDVIAIPADKLSGLLSLDDLAANMSSDRLLGGVLRHITTA